MGNKEEETPTKIPKTSAQEQAPPSSPATVFPDWAAFQAYYNSAGAAPMPPGFYHSPMASSPQGHPYMWGPQHMMPPYGTPTAPYVAMYPPGGIYPHPAMPSVGPAEGDGKSTDAKGRTLVTKSGGSLGSLNMMTGKSGEREKASGASTNGVDSASDESGSDDSTEGSEANSQSGSQENRRHKKNTADGELKNAGTSGSESSKTNRKARSNQVSSIMAIPSSAITAPTTTLNIGMDYWGGASSAAVTPIRSKLPITPSSVPGAPPRAASAPSQEIWSQDERELKRQRRKQSNRESARRSRLRKQAEYDELALRVGSLTEENNRLREELARIRGECEKLASENASLSERVKNSPPGEEQSMMGASGQPETDS